MCSDKVRVQKSALHLLPPLPQPTPSSVFITEQFDKKKQAQPGVLSTRCPISKKNGKDMDLS